MKVERSENEILIRLSAGTDLHGLQRIIDFLKFREITSRSEASKVEIEKLTAKAKSSWWDKNKSKFTK
jgi:hypothetical protein